MENLYNILSNLIAFDTQNNDEIGDRALRGETLDLLGYVKNRLLGTTGIYSHIQEYRIDKANLGNRGNLIALLNDSPEMPRVMMQGHVDTVPFGKHVSPLGRRVGNRVYGRGAIDMKGSVAGMISTFEQIAKKKNRRYSPVLLLTSDEEARNFSGIRNFLKNNNLNIQFGICGEPSNFKIFNRFKGAVHKILEFQGKSAHGSRPNKGHNAIYDAGRAVVLLEEFSRKVFDEYVNLDFRTSDDYSHRSSLNLGKIYGGDKVNSVPDFCKIDFEMRLVHPREFYEEELERNVLSKLKGEFKYSSADFPNNDPINVSSDNQFLTELSNSIIGKIGAVERGVMIGFSEASFTNPAGLNTVVFGPPSRDLSHTEDEQINLEDLKKYEQALISFYMNE